MLLGLAACLWPWLMCEIAIWNKTKKKNHIRQQKFANSFSALAVCMNRNFSDICIAYILPFWCIVTASESPASHIHSYSPSQSAALLFIYFFANMFVKHSDEYFAISIYNITQLISRLLCVDSTMARTPFAWFRIGYWGEKKKLNRSKNMIVTQERFGFA